MVASAVQAALPDIVAAVATAMRPQTNGTATGSTDGPTGSPHTVEPSSQLTATTNTPISPAPSTDGIATELQAAATLAHLGSVIGEDSNENNVNYRRFTSSAVPLHMHVPDTTQIKIKQEQYVDFGTLLPNKHDPTESENLQLKIHLASGQPKIMFQKQNTKKIVYIDQWQKAFEIFSSIYLQQFPQCAIPLIRYGQTIRDLHQKGFDWKLYDTEFRRLRQLEPDTHPWDRLDYELWAFAMHSSHTNHAYPKNNYQNHQYNGYQNPRPSGFGPARPRFQSQSRHPSPYQPQTRQQSPYPSTQRNSTAQGPRFPPNTCWRFQKGYRCGPTCRFVDKHQCCWCQGTHAAVNCPTPTASRRPRNGTQFQHN